MQSRIVDNPLTKSCNTPDAFSATRMNIHVAISESLSDDPKLVADAVCRLVIGKGKEDPPMGMIDELLRGMWRIRSQFGTIASKSESFIEDGLVANARVQFKRLTRRKHCVSYKQLIPKFSSRFFTVPGKIGFTEDFLSDAMDRGWATLWYNTWGRDLAVRYVYPYQQHYGMISQRRKELEASRKRLPAALSDWRHLIPRSIPARIANGDFPPNPTKGVVEASS